MHKVKKILPLLLLVLFVFLVCFKIIIAGEVLFTNDNFDLLFPQKHFWLEEIRRGQLPLWNPYILSGTPYLADINLGTLAPSNLIYFVIHPVEKAASFLLFFELSVIAVFTFLSARRLKISPFSSFFSGVVFALSGTTTVYSNNLAILNVVMYLPVIFYLLLIFLDLRQIKYLFLTAILFSFQILSGHVQLTYISGLFYVILLLSDKQKFKRKLLNIILMFVVALGLSAIQLLPFAEFTLLTPRVGQDYDWATNGSLGLFDLAKLVLPKLTYQFTGWVDFSSKANLGYIGVVPFILLAIGMKSVNSRFRIFKVAALLFLLLSLGGNTPFYKIAYYLVPGLSLFRVPSQFIIIYTFCAALIAGWGMDKLLDFTTRVNGGFKLKWLLPVSTVGFIFFSYWLLKILNNISFFSQYLQQPIKSVIFLTNGIAAAEMLLIFFIVVCLLLLKKKRLVKILLSGVILADLYLSFSANLQTAPISNIKPKVAVNLPTADRNRYRIYTFPPNQHAASDLFSPKVEQIFARQKGEIELPNQNIYKKNYSLDGYASMALGKYLNQFTSANNTITGLGKIDLNKIDLGKYAVKYIVSDQKMLDDINNFRLISEKYPFVYEVKDALPRYFLSNKGEVKLIRQDPVSLSFAIQTESATKLILLDSFYPGWQVKVDGLPVTIDRYEDIYKQVDVPSGNHKIEIDFKPLSFITGFAISATTLCAILILISINRFNSPLDKFFIAD